ncbi:MAG TPA: hypothetical protein DEG06_01655 [Lachnospiraceae bacterium]|jgi:hypothetical protein|nr:hypothetical protein [Lachnospiraceae bacterium]HCA70334.1 hypothetical protein [Lachnospiraceae bacterium]HCM12701.1 hypothetical protein [Lachnospiraceae bacterium]
MFGYVNIYKPELKMKDYYKYKAYYCGLCKTLRERYRLIGQVTLSYDMTFLIILLTSLYESDSKIGKHRCMVHPLQKHGTLQNEFTDYVADMNIVLTYHHLLDDWQDEKRAAGLAGAKLLERYYKKICKQYPRQCDAIKRGLKELSICERNNEQNIDIVSRCFGELMAELFDYKQDRWGEQLRKIGFYLGKFIYIMDAYDDLEKDQKNNSYNPLIRKKDVDGFEENCKAMLTAMLAECTAEFEMLPCLLDIDILRNILYEGVWSKYMKIQTEKGTRKGYNNDK